MKVTLMISEGRRRTVAVESPEFMIGRASDCDLQRQSPLVSRRHCALTVQDGRVYVRDLQSSNGTGLNNQAVVGERLLHDKDELWVAATPIRVRIQRSRNGVGLAAKVLRTLWPATGRPDKSEAPQASPARG